MRKFCGDNPVSHYNVLQVPQGATAETIKKAYWRLARKIYPDLHRPSRKKRAEKELQKLNIAYNCLKNKKSRELYDLQIHQINKKASHNKKKAVNDNLSLNRSSCQTWHRRFFENISEIFWPLPLENKRDEKLKPQSQKFNQSK